MREKEKEKKERVWKIEKKRKGGCGQDDKEGEKSDFFIDWESFQFQSTMSRRRVYKKENEIEWRECLFG